VDGVAAAGAQYPVRFVDDRLLGPVALHGEQGPHPTTTSALWASSPVSAASATMGASTVGRDPPPAPGSRTQHYRRPPTYDLGPSAAMSRAVRPRPGPSSTTSAP